MVMLGELDHGGMQLGLILVRLDCSCTGVVRTKDQRREGMGDALYPALHGLVGKRLHIEAAAEGHGCTKRW